ncbi:hypothetical protein ACH5RR_039061 [Cinchona calisaya]|uniref:Phosphatidylinositol-glycan biosynthesis class X protein n=1 Tax=Cinchona calisaya TaxID=153742 RepID=A0ABD2Y2Q0_9GENT
MEVIEAFQIQSFFLFGLLLFSQGVEEEEEEYISKLYFEQNEILDDSKFARYLESEISPGCQMPRLVGLNRNLIGEGSHRGLFSTIRLESLSLSSSSKEEVVANACEVILIERLPSGVFADPFELQHLIHRGVLSDAAVFGDTNLELPSFRSNRSLVEVHMVITSSMFSQDHKQLEIIIGLPLHARYQPLGHGFSRVEFNLPDILLRCRTERDLHKQSCLLIPTDQSVKSEEAATVWEVPCGKKEHAEIVSIVTFISAILSALLIVWTSVSSPNVAFGIELKQS